MKPVMLAGVTLGVAGRPILSGLDISLEQGEFVGLLGPNGAGKTTLLRSLLGLLAPMAGQVEVLGQPPSRGNPGIGYLPQTGLATIPRIRGRDLLAASQAGHRFGLPWGSEAARARIDASLAQLDAAALARRPLSSLSGGERQRVLIAQALLGAPKLLLLDEPLAGLDLHHQREMVAVLRQVQQAHNITVLCSAHDLNVLLPAMDRVLFLAGGRAALGPVAEIATGPVLSRLYGAPVEVVRAAGHIFVTARAAA